MFGPVFPQFGTVKHQNNSPPQQSAQQINVPGYQPSSNWGTPGYTDFGGNQRTDLNRMGGYWGGQFTDMANRAGAGNPNAGMSRWQNPMQDTLQNLMGGGGFNMGAMNRFMGNFQPYGGQQPNLGMRPELPQTMRNYDSLMWNTPPPLFGGGQQPQGSRDNNPYTQDRGMNPHIQQLLQGSMHRQGTNDMSMGSSMDIPQPYEPHGGQRPTGGTYSPTQGSNWGAGFHGGGGQGPSQMGGQGPQPYNTMGQLLKGGGSMQPQPYNMQPGAGGKQSLPFGDSPSQGGGSQWGVEAPQDRSASVADNFVQGSSTVPQGSSIQGGVGQTYLNQLLQGGTGEGDPYNVEGARGTQYDALTGLLNQPGMSEDEMKSRYEGVMSGVRDELGRARNQSLAGLSGRGMGRSSEAVGNIEDSYLRNLGTAAASTLGGLTGQNVDLQNRNRLAAISGLGGYAGQGIGATGQENQFNLGRGQLGLGSEELGSGNQQFEQNFARLAQDQQFNQGMARAGLDLQKYQSDRGFDLDQYRTDINAAVARGQLDEETARRMDNTMLGVMEGGLRSQELDERARQANMGTAIDYSSQDLGAWNSAEGRQQAGNLAGINRDLALAGMYGNQYGDILNYLMNAANRDAGAYEGRYGREQSRNLQRSMQGGGFGDFMGGIFGDQVAGMANAYGPGSIGNNLDILAQLGGGM